MSTARTARWDVFCRVVDNYGDAGVCWRLARQLAAEHSLAVTLYIDDDTALSRLAPGAMFGATCERVAVHRWPGSGTPPTGEVVRPADVVVEGFGCGLPDAYVEAMACRPVAPRWFVLEYLSAEPWVETTHDRPSPHPRLGLARRFWFPGFTAATGGLLREAGLFAERARYVSDPQAQDAFWRGLGLPRPAPGELRVSLFCYPNTALPALLAAWKTSPVPIGCVVCAGVSADDAGGALALHRIPFVDQRTYDRLLWACDINFVRGEDSFVRAQWAARPLVWHAYPQPGAAEQPKIAAFVDRYASALAPAAGAAVRGIFAAWNGAHCAPPVGDAWRACVAERRPLATHARHWAAELAETEDLAAAMVRAAARDV
jgi:uncharacterized repeat protein (TIGR03837 family)